MSDDLVTFLIARLDEDEKVARLAASYTNRDWNSSVTTDHRLHDRCFPDGDGDPFAEVCFLPPEQPVGVMDHIARHDPARVLTDCAAKRRVIEMCSAHLDNDLGVAWIATDVLLLMVQAHSTHADFDPAWLVD